MQHFESPYAVDYSPRNPAEGVSELFFQRWSPRSFKKVEIPEETLTAIFDAAHWSQSCMNEQPWLFITSSGERDFPTFLALLNEKNQQWAKNASLIGFIVARKHFEKNGTPNSWAQFDSGAAWMALTLQARLLGLYTHGMAGIKKKVAYETLRIPEEEYEVICGFVIGMLDTPDKLPEDVASREKPSPRKSLENVWKQGSFSM